MGASSNLFDLAVMKKEGSNSQTPVSAEAIINNTTYYSQTWT